MTKAKLPLTGIKVVEFAGLAPGPFTGLILADFGADVIRIDKVGAGINPDTLSRGKRSVAVNPKSRSGLRTLRKLIAEADVLIEPFRPGVMEKLGLGPEHVIDGRGEKCTPNPGLVYARLTGFQREGPYANMAGHDINYIALSGVLSMLGQAGGPPQPPANLLADFAGGSLICLTGILMALLARGNQKSGNGGKGQVVEADMVTGARYVATFQILMSYIRHPQWHLMFGKGDNATRGTGVLDGAAPWYGVYKTKDDLWMSVGAIEPQFYAELLRILKASVPNVPAGCPPHPSTEGQHDRDGWLTLRQYLTAIFAQRTRAEWTASFIGTDACTVPVLDRDEALIGDAPGSQGSSYVLPRITKNAEMVREGEEPVPPAPAPRLTATPARTVPGSAVALEAEGGDDESAQLLMTPGEHTIDVLKEWIGASDAQIKQLYQERAIGASDVPDDWDRSSKL